MRPVPTLSRAAQSVRALAKTGREPEKGGSAITDLVARRTSTSTSTAAHLHLWLRALLTLAVLLASPRGFAHANASSRTNANDFANTSQPSGPPRPGEARRKGVPGRAQLASTPGRTTPRIGGAAPHPLWIPETKKISASHLERRACVYVRQSTRIEVLVVEYDWPPRKGRVGHELQRQ